MSKKVLVVDDNQDAINILSAILKKAGYLVGVAKDGQEALQKISSDIPALILLDVMMPKMDGYEVCKAIKTDPNVSQIPILMISAKTDGISQKRGLELGAADYLMKPIQPNEILRKVRQYLGDDSSSNSNPPSSSPKLPMVPLILSMKGWFDFQLAPFFARRSGDAA
jgi:two-component system alkaline phosphatase synthesis response regulator PhoP